MRRFHSGYVVDEAGCWRWVRRLGPFGYGRYGKGGHAHRWAYTNLVGPIPATLTIDHLCRVKSCVNPAHMEPVTLLVNIARGDVIGKGWRRELTHCRNGHPFDDVNTYRYSDSAGHHRRCQTCHREAQAAYKRRVRSTRIAA